MTTLEKKSGALYLSTRWIIVIILLTGVLFACRNIHEEKGQGDMKGGIRDLTFFLQRIRTLDHLPELEASHTAMSSTWDTTGQNNDGLIYKNVQDTINILLDKDGPGCIHRIFTGTPYFQHSETRLQIFIDGQTRPVFDLTVGDLFDPARSPFPYPLSSNKTYAGILFPIPYDKHIRVQLYNPLAESWGNYWQVVYTSYPENVKIKSITYPFSDNENKEIQKVVDMWLKAERNPPTAPGKWPFKREVNIKSCETGDITLNGTGIIKQLYISANPNKPETWRNTRFIIQWDNNNMKSIDVPLGYFFGNADYASMFQYNSMIAGITKEGAYSLLPMPFVNGAKLVFENHSKEDIELEIKMDIQEEKSLQSNVGRLHATFNEIQPFSNDYDNLPRFGKSTKPFLVTLEKNSGPGKYVGTLLHVAWPDNSVWWGEGDWLFWTDEEGFPPSYHGTGSEEYFNSGWCFFDRKAISGYVKMAPGNVSVYSFHLNDAFEFTDNIRAAVEIWPWQEIKKSIWSSTAFWYANPPQYAGSRQNLAFPRLLHHGNLKGEKGIWEDE